MRHGFRTLQELELIVENFCKALSQGESATLVTLSGELGAGKTTFSQFVGKYFGVSETIQSPTFVLERVYELKEKPFSKLIHIDAYRLKSGEEIKVLSFDELLKDNRNLILLEWPEMVKEALPKVTYKLSITVEEDGSRTLTSL